MVQHSTVALLRYRSDVVLNHDPCLMKGDKMLSVGIIASKRPYLSETLVSVKKTLDCQVHVFAEPDVPGFCGMSDVILHQHTEHHGCVKNWLSAAKHFVEHGTTDFFAICEDDIEFVGGADLLISNLLKVLRGDIWVPIVQDKMPLDEIGFISPYCSLLNKPLARGWNPGRYNLSGLCGALCLIFPKQSLKYIVEKEAELLEHSGGICLDYGIGKVLEEKINLTHLPTLVLHTGEVSTYDGNNLIHNKLHEARQPAL